jgi:hypothetical protein
MKDPRITILESKVKLARQQLKDNEALLTVRQSQLVDCEDRLHGAREEQKLATKLKRFPPEVVSLQAK